MLRINVEHLTKRFGDHTVIDNLSLTVNEGEIVVFRGPSGIGKSTFLRCLTYLEPFQRGRVVIGDQSIEAGMDVHAQAHRLQLFREQTGFVFQFFNLFPHLTVLENLTIAPIRVLGMPPAQAREEAMQLLSRVGLAEKAHVLPHSLSGGQKQRISIARCLAMHPKVILFDEPTASLDPEMKAEMAGVIESFEQGLTMLIVTHEPAFVERIATRIITFGPGCAIEQDTRPTTTA